MTRYGRVLRAAGIILTTGTEHNLLEMVPIAPTAARREALSTELRELFYEGACVVAAHQFLGAHGEVGYGDLKGATREGRVKELAALGGAVIGKYLEAK